MKVTCPNCKTTYNLPDGKARPGVKLRCTVCRQVFTLPQPEDRQSVVKDSEKMYPSASESQTSPKNGAARGVFFF